ncbi:hypothetical protein L533_1460 [Bordetella bronchiseptica OSU553]|nr:hypothetical protein L533_1460 [Bordetella bronchiseptica OSU553]
MADHGPVRRDHPRTRAQPGRHRRVAMPVSVVVACPGAGRLATVGSCALFSLRACAWRTAGFMSARNGAVTALGACSPHCGQASGAPASRRARQARNGPHCGHA